MDGAKLGTETHVEVAERQHRPYMVHTLGGQFLDARHFWSPLLWRGSKASRNPSPIKLTLRAIARMNKPGNQNSHGREVNEFWYRLINEPRDTSGGWTPKPRKLKDVSSKI